MKSFDEYFSEDNIIKMVVKFRMATAKKRHKIHLIRDISYHEKTNLIGNERFMCPTDLSAILPPRKKWIRPHRYQRSKLKSSHEVTMASILRKVKQTETFLASGLLVRAPKWYRNLRFFVEKVRHDALFSEDIVLNKPDIVPIEKIKRSPKGECRPIAMYGYRDKIIIGLCSKYFTDLFDPVFQEPDCSYAFRSGLFTKVKTHHDAVDHILKFRTVNRKELWSAECDIKKFFDCVNHELLISIFDRYVLEFEHQGIFVDKRSRCIFYAYLNSYAFNFDVYSLNGTSYFDLFQIKNGFFKWEKDSLVDRFYPGGIDNLRLGVPQGGALSCFISNLFLHEVDMEVYKAGSDSVYVRYCDDMVILHKDKSGCQEALDRYSIAIGHKMLLIHDPQEVSYSTEYWGEKATKSKKPYLWSTVSSGGIPWLAFVGYQIRYDGCIRVRKSSIDKEKEKQKKETDRVLNAIDFRNPEDLNLNSRKSLAALEFALNHRLISMSAGRIKLHNYGTADPTMCWTNGFRAVSNNHSTRNQFRGLDKTRANQLKRFRKQLMLLDKVSEDVDDVDILPYYGKPYSYYCFLEHDIVK
ncbi:reverse transcriptase domain-containing protein [Pedobacter suwonensis]|uniref:reverse transcriptase domain-containing protein n=1 Tax=Pedobacter suwonensis TaxID=332999 RepID=UPI0036766722